MLHAVRLKGGRASSYSNSFVMTNKLKKELERGHPVQLKVWWLEVVGGTWEQ